METHATDECRGCEWESFPQAFRWFPEMGEPWAESGDRSPARDGSPAAGTRAAAGSRVRSG